MSAFPDGWIQVIRFLDILTFAATLALGVVILRTSWVTIGPRRDGPGLMWWHILAITLSTWGWEALALSVVISRYLNNDPLTWVGPAYLFLGQLTNYALWLIIKVQRGRLLVEKHGP